MRAMSWVGMAAAAALAATVLPGAALAAGPAHLRVVDACTCGTAGITVSVGATAPIGSGMLAYDHTTGYAEVPAGSQRVVVTGYGPAGAVPNADLAAGCYYDLVFTGEPGNPYFVVRETGDGSDRATAVLHVVRTADLGLPVTVRLDHGTVVASSLGADEDARALAVAPGHHELEVYSLTGYLLGRLPVDLHAGEETTGVLTGGPGAVPLLSLATAVGPQVPVAPAATRAVSPSGTVGAGTQTAAVTSSTGGTAAPSVTGGTTGAAGTGSEQAGATVPAGAGVAVPTGAAAAVPTGGGAGVTLPKTGGNPLDFDFGVLALAAGAALVWRRRRA